MSCQWHDRVALYVDDELNPFVQQEFSAHLSSCPKCRVVAGEQMALKEAVRTAGRIYGAPLELHTTVYRSIHPHKDLSLRSKWVLVLFSLLLLSAIILSSLSRSQRDPMMMAALVDQHTTMLASDQPVDVVSDDGDNVIPWFQGKLPFAFKMPDVAGSPFTLIGGKTVHIGRNPSAELVYTVGLHKISVFILQVRRGEGRSGSSHELTFTVESWSQGGLQCYLVTDATHEEVSKLVSMFREANAS
jgi:anti-sigma factor RsiW